MQNRTLNDGKAMLDHLQLINNLIAINVGTIGAQHNTSQSYGKLHVFSFSIIS